MKRRQSQGVPKGGYGSLACPPIRRRSRSKSRSPRSSPSSGSGRSKSRSTRSSRERARRRRRRRRRRSRSESSSSSDSSSSSSGSRGSSRRRGSNHSGSRPSPRGMPIAAPHFGKHGSGNGMMGMGMMGMNMGGVPLGGMGVGGVSMVGGGIDGGVGGGSVPGSGKDYAAMASVVASPSAREPFAMRSHAVGGRGYAPTGSLHANGPLGRSIPPAGGGKDYASLADAGSSGSRLGGGGGGGGGGGDRRGGGLYADQARDVRHAGRMLGAAISGGLLRGSGTGGASGSGTGGRFERGGKAPPSPPGRDQFGRERDWRGTAPNGRRAAAPASNGQPPVVHGSGFGTFSMASSILMGSNSGVSLQGPAAAPASKQKASAARDSRSPARGGAQASASSSFVPLTRAELVRQHSRREQWQRQQSRRPSTSPSSCPSLSSSSEDGRHRHPDEERKRQVNLDEKHRNSSELRDRNARSRGDHHYQHQQQHQHQGSKGVGEGKSRDRQDAIVSPAAHGSLSRSARDRPSSPCAGAGADGKGNGNVSRAPPSSIPLRPGRMSGAGGRDCLESRVKLPKGDDPGGGGGSASGSGKSPTRQGTTNGSRTANGRFPAERESDRSRAPPWLGGGPRGQGHGQGRHATGNASSPNEDAEHSCGEAEGSYDEGEVSAGGGRERQRRREREGDARDWKRDVYRGGVSDSHRRPSGCSNGGGTSGSRGLIRERDRAERDRADSPRDRGRYNPTPPQPPPLAGTDDQQEPSSLGTVARSISLGFNQSVRGDRQEKGDVSRGVAGEGEAGGGHKRPRSPEPVGMDLESDSPSPPPNRHQDLRSQDSRGPGANHSDLNSSRPVNPAPNRHGRDGRSSPPADSRHAAERTQYPRHKPPPLQATAPNGPLGKAQHHQSRHSHRHNPSQDAAGTVPGPRPGRSSSHPVTHAERSGSRLSSNARVSPAPTAGHGNSGRGSPLARRGSPLQPGHGARSQGSPKPTHSSQTFCPYGTRSCPISSHGAGADAGDGGTVGGTAGVGESNGWAPGRRLRGPVITDRLVSLKAEFLELHDMLLESDFQWEQSQKFCEMLKVQLDQLMLAPHRNRDPLAQPPAR